jgi:hypothetical protein
MGASPGLDLSIEVVLLFTDSLKIHHDAFRRCEECNDEAISTLGADKYEIASSQRTLLAMTS